MSGEWQKVKGWQGEDGKGDKGKIERPSCTY